TSPPRPTCPPGPWEARRWGRRPQRWRRQPARSQPASIALAGPCSDGAANTGRQRVPSAPGSERHRVPPRHALHRAPLVGPAVESWPEVAVKAARLVQLVLVALAALYLWLFHSANPDYVEL